VWSCLCVQVTPFTPWPCVVLPLCAGDTLCDFDQPIVLERMEFPEPVIKIAVEPKSKADSEKMGLALAKLAQVRMGASASARTHCPRVRCAPSAPVWPWSTGQPPQQGGGRGLQLCSGRRSLPGLHGCSGGPPKQSAAPVHLFQMLSSMISVQ